MPKKKSAVDGTIVNRHKDLRDFLDRVEGMGELRQLDGVDWNLEMGALAEMVLSLIHI